MAEQGKTIISVRVQPNASRNEVSGFRDGVWLIKVTAPPVKGKANQEVLKFLSDILGISPSRLNIEKGETGRRKVIGISGLTINQATARLEETLANKPGK